MRFYIPLMLLHLFLDSKFMHYIGMYIHILTVKFVDMEWIRVCRIPCEPRLGRRQNNTFCVSRESYFISRRGWKQFFSVPKHTFNRLLCYSESNFFLTVVRTQRLISIESDMKLFNCLVMKQHMGVVHCYINILSRSSLSSTLSPPPLTHTHTQTHTHRPRKSKHGCGWRYLEVRAGRTALSKVLSTPNLSAFPSN
jgi:hypothetical protein